MADSAPSTSFQSPRPSVNTVKGLRLIKSMDKAITNLSMLVIISKIWQDVLINVSVRSFAHCTPKSLIMGPAY